MSRRPYKPEEIVGKLRQTEVLHGQGLVWRRRSGRRGSARSRSTGSARSTARRTAISYAASSSSRRRMNGCGAQLPT